MYEVQCPVCNKVRIVKTWNGDSGPPYIRKCRICTQLNQSVETREKKSKALKGVTKPAEYSERLKKRHLEDPSLRKHLIAGQGAGHNKGQITGPMSEVTKKKISESMKKKRDNI